jgi:hypothetical protein
MTMIEKMARALYDYDSADFGVGCFDPWKDCKGVYVRQARAALQAILEPSEAVRSAGEREGLGRPLNANPRHVWTAMIDAILAEKPNA